MSRVAPGVHEYAIREKRRPTSVKVQELMYNRQGGRCAMCEGVIHYFMLDCDVDHIIPLELCGTNHPDNLQALCRPCHKIKTKADVKAIAKAKRLAGETGQGPKRKIAGRGFDKTLSKGMDGKVRSRGS